jgi:DNA (cytosine-5)-methyltransferase 1
MLGYLVRMAVPQLTAIDLFCGAGGLTEGFKRAGYRVVYALDHDKECWETYRLNHPEVRAEHLEISSLSPKDLAHRINERVDVILGGPSCQGFSTANRRKKVDGDHRNELWAYMLALTKLVKPRAFLLENVPGLMYWRGGQFGPKILKGFEDAGYRVSFDILLAANFGVPQLRRRLFMVGLLGGKFKFPMPLHLGAFRRDGHEKWERIRRQRRLPPHLTAWEAISDLPSIRDGRGAEISLYTRSGKLTPYAKLMREGGGAAVRDHEIFPLSPEHAALVKEVPPGGTWRDIPSFLLPERFFGIRRTDSSNLLGRLDPQRPAYTVTTSFSNVTAGCFVHPWEDRVLSVREGARLQAFRDSYRFYGTLTARYRMVGNAVPPFLATVLAKRLARQLHDRQPMEIRRQRAIVKPAGFVVPAPIDETTGRRMRRQPRRDTRPEVLLRKELHFRGLRFRVCAKPLPTLRREVDIWFPSSRVAVFVDGCFWHGCRLHSRPTRSHTFWWAAKIKANRRRDSRTTQRLKDLGWTVVRIWEHQRPAQAADIVERALGRKPASMTSPPSSALDAQLGYAATGRSRG